jgi:predicted adenine nucleotide alpha hydrolase (AANH) superfamily ATPase
MKENYQKLMEEEIERNNALGVKPTLLLHACCAPCSSGVLPVLVEHFKITIFFHNPNISPESEYNYRLEELKRLVGEMGYSDIEIVEPEYKEEEFLAIAKGREDLPEGGARCKDCYRLRLSATAEYAKEKGFDYFTTTLTVSPYKNAEYLNEIGRELSDEYGVKYLLSDFKKKEGYKRSCENSKKYGLYRQIYCGCVYSKAKAEERMK